MENIKHMALLLAAGMLFAQAPDNPKMKETAVDSTAATVVNSDNEELIIIRKGKNDTVLHISHANILKWMDKMSERVDKSRKQGYGGAGGWTPMAMGIDLAPVRELLNREPDLRGKDFGIDHDYALFFGSGGMGYGGIGNGVRIGGLGWGGSRQYVSLPFGAAGDSLAQISVSAGFGGFLVEKAFVRDRMNYMAGAIFGGGSIDVQKNFYKESEPTAFTGNMGTDNETASATFAFIEVHGGFTYTMTRWFHAGADLNMAGFISSDGFGGLTSGFMSLNPGARIRIIFGNLG
ncbi:MAG: hypothetical protein V1913_09735 [Fibrobacterota bacterium]